MTSIYTQPRVPTLNNELVFLVVDDFDAMRRITVNQLRILGAEKILTAGDGRAALRILKSQHIDCILSDWNMPVMSGIDLLKAMREDSKLFKLPFIMITAEAERAHVEEAIACGVTSMILKPYSPSQLMVRVEKALCWQPGRAPTAPSLADATATTQRAEAIAARASRARQKPSVLIVDDTPDNLMILSDLLKSEYDVRLAQNGPKALEFCTSDDPPDLVLLDIMMPGMDGFEVAQKLREHPTSESIPIVFVTALTTNDARMKGLDLGAIDFITKPVDPDALKQRVRNFMRYVQLRKNLQVEIDSMVETAKLKEDVANITRHDMKAPLAGVLGVLQALIHSESLVKRDLEQVKLAEETTLQVLNMVNLSAELFKIETGRFKLQAAPVQIVDILRRIVEINQTTWASKDLKTTVTIVPPSSEILPQALGDAMLCYSLFQNLLKNACEAAPDGSTISVKVHAQSPLRIVIENQGAVPADIRERFFEKYATSGKQDGTGLGTYSAKLLTEAQNGSIALAVSDEHNTTGITVTLPRA
jgi:two-component system sensor histidine kinase/response regulator